MNNYEKTNIFREPLFNFYRDRQDSLGNFRNFNRILGLSAITASVLAYGVTAGVGLGLVAGWAMILNERACAILEDKISIQHQRILGLIYKSQDLLKAAADME